MMDNHSISPIQTELHIIKNIPEKRVGSILLYAIEPKTDQMYILLGKEQYSKRWIQSSDKWCGFGGRIHHNENIEQGVAREVIEETLGVVHMTDYYSEKGQVKKYELIDQVVKMLEDKKYEKLSITKRRHNFIIYRFVKKIKWDPYIPSRFKKCRRYLATLRQYEHNYIKYLTMNGHDHVLTKNCENEILNYCQNIPNYIKKHPALGIKIIEKDGKQKLINLKVDDSYLEKSQVCWFSVHTLRDLLNTQPQMFRASWSDCVKQLLLA